MAKKAKSDTGVPIEEIDAVRFFTHDDQADVRGNNEPGGDVWINAADMLRAIRDHEEKIFAAAAESLGGFQPLLRESIKAANTATISLVNRLIVEATKTARRGSN